MASAKDIAILIVDDDPDLLESITSLFSIFGFSVDDAKGGVAAWEKLQQKKFDIVITDVKMPDMSGIELLKKIRAHDPFIPKVLLISGHSDSSIQEIFNLGANGFFGKPFNATAVRESLTQTLLSPVDKWSKPVKRFGSLNLDKKFKTLSEASADHEFNLGQSGFFLAIEESIPSVGDFIDFDIAFEDGKPFNSIKGVGHVVWSRLTEEYEKPKGIGVKFNFLDESSLNPFIDWVAQNRPIATIPQN